MSTATNGTTDNEKAKEQPRAKGGVTAEDRAKGFGEETTGGPVNESSSDPKRQE